MIATSIIIGVFALCLTVVSINFVKELKIESQRKKLNKK